MIRSAIVGLGWWGKTIVDAVHGKSDKIKFVAANTRTRAKAEDFCKERNIDLRDSLDALIDDPDIDAIVYTTPHSKHEEHVKQAAAAGKHVFVEKPFTLDVKSAKATVDAARKAGIVLGIDYQRRFHPSMALIRERIKSGALGTLCFCVGEATAPAGLFLPKESWRVNPEETPAGAMTGLGVHLVDGFIDLCGEVAEVYCVNTRRAAIVDDTTTVVLTHKSGVFSTVLCCLATAPHYRVAAYGTKGLAEAEKAGLDTFRFIPAPDKPGHAPGAPEIVDDKGFNLLKAGLESFVDAIEGGDPFPITTDEMIHGVAVFEAIVESAKTGKPVKVG